MTTLQDCQCCQCNEENYQIENTLRRTWNLIKRTARRYRKWRKMKHDHHLLVTMDARMLKDIGLSRADAIRVSNEHTFWKYMFQPDSDGRKDGAGRRN